MNVIIINQYFYPDVSATAQLLTDLVDDLAAKGIKITILTGHEYERKENTVTIDFEKLGSLTIGQINIRDYQIGGIIENCPAGFRQCPDVVNAKVLGRGLE